MDRVELEDGRSFLIAIPEKALADHLVAQRGAGLTSQKELHDYLVDNLRVAETTIRELDPARLMEIAEHYRSRRIRLLADLVRRMRKSGKGDGNA